MQDLASRGLTASRAGDQPVSPDEIPIFLASLPGWQIVERENLPRLEKSYSFKNFQEALDFTVQVGGLAEAVNHHPAILVSWGRAAVSWWTHAIKGLHQNDFIMAARTEQLYQTYSQNKSS